jgi:hypothetical protein
MVICYKLFVIGYSLFVIDKFSSIIKASKLSIDRSLIQIKIPLPAFICILSFHPALQKSCSLVQFHSEFELIDLLAAAFAHLFIDL